MREFTDGGQLRMLTRSTTKAGRQLVVAFDEQDGLCFYCDRKCWLPWEGGGGPGREPGLMATREHLIRTADGGNNTAENIAMACFYCNSRRGQRAPEEWIAERGGEPPADTDGCVTYGSILGKTFDFDAKAHAQSVARSRKKSRKRPARPNRDQKVIQSVQAAVAKLDAHKAERGR